LVGKRQRRGNDEGGLLNRRTSVKIRRLEKGERQQSQHTRVEQAYEKFTSDTLEKAADGSRETGKTVVM
jgi:hypothetical protein